MHADGLIPRNVWFLLGYIIASAPDLYFKKFYYFRFRITEKLASNGESLPAWEKCWPAWVKSWPAWVKSWPALAKKRPALAKSWPAFRQSWALFLYGSLDFLKHAYDCLCIQSLPQMFGVLWSFKNGKPEVLLYLCIFLLILFSYSYEESRFGRLQY